MAMISIGESRWRMLRMALRTKTFKFDDVRTMSRTDQKYFDWLIAHGFIEELSGGNYKLSAKGVATADLGLYEWTSTPAPVATPTSRAKAKKK